MNLCRFIFRMLFRVWGDGVEIWIGLRIWRMQGVEMCVGAEHGCTYVWVYVRVWARRSCRLLARARALSLLFSLSLSSLFLSLSFSLSLPESLFLSLSFSFSLSLSLTCMSYMHTKYHFTHHHAHHIYHFTHYHAHKISLYTPSCTPYLSISTHWIWNLDTRWKNI